ncbi:MAG: NAD-dependent epimerase/dehydratase [bacterium]|nr:MAG: NAD-dependent epimerase/dehydratase [bacterium]
MKCVVTGANGFLGQVLIKNLLEKGHSVLGLVRRVESKKVVTQLGAEVEQADLFEVVKLSEILKKYKPNTIFHLAAEIATQRNKDLIYRVNVEGTRLLAEACRGLNLTSFIYASSVVIGNPKGLLIDEKSSLIATTTYGKSKQQAEVLLLNEMKTHSLPVVILRPSHVYGYGGWYGELVGEMLKGRFMIPGDGENWWDVVHVDDVADAFRLAAETPMKGEVFHIVDDQPILMKDFFANTAKALNLGKPWHIPKFIASLVRGSEPIAAAVRSAKSNNSKLKQQLGWQPKYPNSEVGIKHCVSKLKELK